VTDDEARELELHLEFLSDGQDYLATIYADGEDANWKTQPHSYVIKEIRVDRDSRLELDLVPGGGAAVRIRPILKGTIK